MTRPLARLGIDELEALFETSKHDLPALKRLIGELAFRNVPRATALLDKAQRVFKFIESHRGRQVPEAHSTEAPKDLAGTPTPIQNGFEFDVPTFIPAELPKRSAKPSQVTVAQPIPVVLPTFTEPEQVPATMPLEQAYRVLKATPASSWDAIEFSRRQVVARAQPDKVAKLEPVKRKALLDEAREANIAYKVLLLARS